MEIRVQVTKDTVRNAIIETANKNRAFYLRRDIESVLDDN